MKSIKKTVSLFKFNMPAIILFELLYKILTLAFLTPAIYALLNYSVECADISYLTTKNIGQYLKTPTTYCVFVVILMIVSLYILIDISALILAMDDSKHEEKSNPLKLLFRGTLNGFRVINPRNFAIMPYATFVLPFTYTVFISGSLAGFHLPEVFSKVVQQHRSMINVMLVGYLLFAVVAMQFVFSLNHFVLYKLNFNDAIKMSKKTVKKHKVKTSFGIVLWNGVITATMFLLEGVMASIVVGFLKIILSYKEVYFVFTNIVKVSFWLMYLFFSLIATPLIVAYICNSFYEIEGDYNWEGIEKNKRNKKEKSTGRIKKKKKIVVVGFVVTIAVALNAIYIYMGVTNRVSLKIAYPTTASVTAHRGDSKHAPENTLSSIALAIENQADIIEIDIRQTKDGKYVVAHDESLLRVAGIESRVGDLTLEELKKIEIGSRFSDEYAGETLASFEEVLAICKENDVFLNIELKPSSTDHNYVEGVLLLLEEYDYIDNCYVASADYSLLTQIKDLNRDIKTLYIMGMAFGNFGKMDKIDAFSIRYNFISSQIVADIHKEGKLIYGWTVNKEEDIKELLLLDVDGVITDDPYSTKNIIYNANDSLVTDWLKRLVREY